jgi:hypothetical protein
MDKEGENEFTFRLEGRNINETADKWSDIVVGEVLSTGTPHAVAGTLRIDYSAIHAIDSAHSVPYSGTISYTYDVTKFPYSVDCEFEAFEYEPGRFLDATYSYRRLDENMSGELTFDMVADVWPEEEPDGQDETLVVESKWNANGKGRAQAVMSGGTLELEGSVVERGIIEECWADSAGLFYSTYQTGTIEYSDGTPAETLPGCGEPEHCPEIGN